MTSVGCLGLAHPEPAPMEQWRRRLLEVDQHDQQPIFWGRPGTVLRGRVTSRLPAPAMARPCGHVTQECRLKGGPQRRKLVHGQARQIYHGGAMGWKIAIASRERSLLSWRAQYHRNHDEFYILQTDFRQGYGFAESVLSLPFRPCSGLHAKQAVWFLPGSCR
jgi:hypothetical protein